MTKRQRGTLTNLGKPNWGPLLNLAPDEAPAFMWMFGVALDAGGRAYITVGRARYEEVDSVALLIEVLEVAGVAREALEKYLAS